MRAAVGLFYGSVSGNELNSTADNQPFTVRQRFNNVRSLTDVYGDLPGGVSPFPYSFTPANPRFIFPASVAGPALGFKWPYTYQMNFSVQRQVRRDLSVEGGLRGLALPQTAVHARRELPDLRPRRHRLQRGSAAAHPARHAGRHRACSTPS